MSRSSFGRVSVAVVGMVAAFCAVPVLAQQSAALSVGARVAPQCRISVAPGPDDDRSPAVHVQCGRAGLRALRVTTDRGDSLQPTTTFAGRQLQAGGEVVFLVATPLTTVASVQPVTAQPTPRDRRRIVTVTLDF